MSVFGEDPTPCPLPRYGCGINPQARRTSIFVNTEPSAILPNGLGLKDAKPRRPRKRQSVGWDPTVDIYDDTCALQKPAAAPPQQNFDQAVGANIGKTQNRTSSFAQSAQRILQQSENADEESEHNNRKRRLSSAVSQPQLQPQTSLQAQPEHHTLSADTDHGSTIRKEARRRTIYVPSEDTTILTIHPGGSLYGRGNGPRRPRRSDIFLDILSEEDSETVREQDLDSALDVVNAVNAAVKRPARKSLAAAPRRAPLQQSARQVQAQTYTVDIPGKSGGKENEPPNALKEVKRLGKRASFIVPEKSLYRRGPQLDAISEVSSQKAALPPSIQSDGTSEATQLQTGSIAPSDTSQSARQSRLSQVRRSSILPGSGSYSMHRQSLVPARSSSNQSAGLFTERVPTSLKIPRLPVLDLPTQEKYPIISEDIADPSMYENSWLSQQEQSLAQLVNSLFERTQFSKGSTNAISASASLRQELLNMYYGGENPLLHKRLQASLHFGALSVPSQTLAQVARFKHDFGQRQRFLDLWTKTYDLELLQTAAEVVIGRKRALTPRNSGDGSKASSPSTSRSKSVTSFLKTFLVYNQDTARPLAPGNASLRDGMTGNGADMADGWQRTVLRSLMLIHLLDRAHTSGVSSAPLFQRTSPYKSSLSVLQGLCRLLIPSVGDIARILGHLGYQVSCVQFPLEEYDYCVSNLATDLRDGVRLTRLVEVLLYPPGSLEIEQDASTAGATITMPCGDIRTLATGQAPRDHGSNKHSWPLSQHLKYPCISRTQKIYNTQIALSALSSVKDIGNLLEELKAEDIVDGHREKTVRLLWGLVSRWGLGSLIDFSLVERETRRLANVGRKQRKGASEAFEDSSQDDDAELPYLTGLERHTALLKSWATHAARLHGITVSNLSTSFADGRAYKAIVDEYVPCLPVAGPATSNFANSTAPATRRSTRHSDPPHITALRTLGCSQSFLKLFNTPSTSASNGTIPSRKTTIPLLAFLASRLLPLAEPYFAARAIQNAWRRSRIRFEVGKLLKCAILARRCREVVELRGRIEWAVVVIQRRWRRVCWL